MVALKAENLLTCLYVPQLRRVVHRARGHEHAVRVEREAHNFHFVALERVVALAGVRVPDLRLPVEGAGHDFVSVGVVEGHRVDDVRVLVEGKQFLARVRVPDLARAVVAARDELAAALVEGAVRERQKVRSKDLEKSELLHLVFLLFLDELFDEFFELGLAGFRDEWLFEQNLVNKAVDVRF